MIFDACSGRGIGALLLSFWFPNAKIGEIIISFVWAIRLTSCFFF